MGSLGTGKYLQKMSISRSACSFMSRAIVPEPFGRRPWLQFAKQNIAFSFSGRGFRDFDHAARR